MQFEANASVKIPYAVFVTSYDSQSLQPIAPPDNK